LLAGKGYKDMKCPLCNAPTETKNTVNNQNGTIRRRRVCFNMHWFATEEKPVTEPKLKSEKKRTETLG